MSTPVERVIAALAFWGRSPRKVGNEQRARCPVPAHGQGHGDRNPSLSVGTGNDGRALIRCHAGCSTESIVGALDMTLADLMPATAIWSRDARSVPPSAAQVGSTRPSETFAETDARRTWEAALARARDDDHVHADHAVYTFLRSRGLIEAWELEAFGIIAAGMNLPPAIASWPASGHQLVVPLYNQFGVLSNVQARAIRMAEKKTRFPYGSRAAGTIFASRSGLAVLKGQWTGPKIVILGEGLTDFLALSITASLPVLSAPGSGLAARCIGLWVAGFTVLLALDNDGAGESAVDVTAAHIYQHGGARIRRLKWPDGSKDVCDMLQRYGPASVIAAIGVVARG